MSNVSLPILALLMGFTGSLHCAGMCGPIMLFMPFHQFRGVKKGVAVGLYHLARISVYVGMAWILYSFRALFQPAIQQYVSIILGSLLLIAGVLSFLPLTGQVKMQLPWSGYVKKQLSSFLAQPGMTALAMTGILNGLLPCGLVYMALSAAVALSSPGQAVLFTFLFGAGTVPMLASIALLKYRIPFVRNGHFKKFTPVIVFCFGCLFLLRGMNLGIPYLSPKVQVSNGKVLHSCCHRK